MPSPAPPAAADPVVIELPPDLDPSSAFARLLGLRGCLLLDSAMRHERLGRYTYLAADPFDWVTSTGKQDGLAQLVPLLDRFRSVTNPELPPFQGGVAGMFGYDLCRSLEKLPTARHDDIGLPTMSVGLYDVVLAFDHLTDKSWLVSQGFPETNPGARRRRAEHRAEQFMARLSGEGSPAHRAAGTHTLSPIVAPQHPLPGHGSVTSDFSRQGYIDAVARAVEYIHAGDVFQVNLTQRLLAPLVEPASEYYLRLRKKSPAPFGAYFDAGHYEICSASPERFLQCVDREVESRPIKGTRPRSTDPAQDARWADELLGSEKDLAENTMIVDLLRNDLSCVCTDDSVEVPTLCGLESYQQVHHLVSVVRGRLRDDATPLDLLRAAFPGGSITGAPKVRAMEIIAELEPTVRGPYCGSIGYIGFNGAMDSSILIRTAIAAGGWLQMPVGGGVVADSDPAAEYEETLQKAAGMLAALEPGT